MRVGLGHDTHRLESGRPLHIGGVRIESDLGAVGHSDADVLLHALTDAMLGAAGLGDIGEHFPDTDPQWEGADSAHFVRSAKQLIDGAGWLVANVDCTVFAQRPKLSPYKAEIRQSLAALLDIDGDQVNVKAKTGERVGTIGRGEAIEAAAIVLLLANGNAS